LYLFNLGSGPGHGRLQTWGSGAGAKLINPFSVNIDSTNNVKQHVGTPKVFLEK
jgi:hypothetical protein